MICAQPLVVTRPPPHTHARTHKQTLQVVRCPIRGRGQQLNYGAHAARADADVLLFLHADSTLPVGYASGVSKAMHAHTPSQWGCFSSIKLQVCVC